MENYWLLSAGKDGELWPVFWTEKLIAIGWSALGDLRQHQSRAELESAYKQAYPTETSGTRRNHLNQLIAFRDRIQKQELVIVRSYGAIIGYAEVQTDYEFLTDGPLRKKLYSPFFQDEYPHIRRVRWLSVGGGFKQSLTLTRLTLMP
jgi:predicted Mrr-cat superfamily restriction endonuclease